jgi:hypothetical protein
MLIRQSVLYSKTTVSLLWNVEINFRGLRLAYAVRRNDSADDTWNARARGFDDAIRILIQLRDSRRPGHARFRHLFLNARTRRLFGLFFVFHNFPSEFLLRVVPHELSTDWIRFSHGHRKLKSHLPRSVNVFEFGDDSS